MLIRSLCILTADCDDVELCELEDCIHGQKECSIGNEGKNCHHNMCMFKKRIIIKKKEENGMWRIHK